MLIGTNMPDLSLKRLSVGVSRIPLPELSKLRPGERSLRNSRIAI
jgi:hypothetical protein